MRYRGPYEYDKFILNVLQYHNTIHNIYENLHKQDAKNLAATQKSIDDLNKKLADMNNQLMTYKEGAREL